MQQIHKEQPTPIRKGDYMIYQRLFAFSLSISLLSCTSPTEVLNTNTSQNQRSSSAEPQTLLLSQDSIKLASGETLRLDAAVTLSDGSFSKEVTWLSSDSNIVVVSPQGELQRIGAGDVFVIAIATRNPQIRKQVQILDPESAGSIVPQQTPIPVATALNPGQTATSPGLLQPTLPPLQLDMSTMEETTLNGKIYDDHQTPMEDVTVTIKSLNSAVNFIAETRTVSGTYLFNAVPSGVQMEIVASKAGYTTRRRVEVPKSNKDGDPNANKYDFGVMSASSNSTANLALSDSPEVIRISPERNSSDISAASKLILTFNEPVDRQSVENSLSIYPAGNFKLQNDGSSSPFTFYEPIENNMGTLIFHYDDFDARWNNNDTEVELTLRNGLTWPTNADNEQTPSYQISFKRSANTGIKDKNGNTRGYNYFRLNDGQFENEVKFSVSEDLIEPKVVQVSAETSERGGSNGDLLKVRFDERMALLLRSGIFVTGGMGDTSGEIAHAVAGQEGFSQVTPEAVAGNYHITQKLANGQFGYSGSLKHLGGRVVFDSNNDSSYTTVRLLLPLTTLDLMVNEPIIGTQNIIVEHIFIDGSSCKITHEISENTYQSLQDVLNESKFLSAGQFTVVPTDSPNGPTENIDIKDKFKIALSSDAKGPIDHQKGPQDKTILLTRIHAEGAFSSTYLNAPSSGYLVAPGVLAGARLELFKSGDTLQVEVASGVTDPAGNRMSTSHRKASIQIP
jgi:hypothetical protein